MEVVLRQDVDKLGLRGEVVSVARGYARNFLLPRGLAEPATPGLVRELERRDAERARHDSKTVDEARVIASRLEKLELRFDANAGPTGSPSRTGRWPTPRARRANSGRTSPASSRRPTRSPRADASAPDGRVRPRSSASNLVPPCGPTALAASGRPFNPTRVGGNPPPSSGHASAVGAAPLHQFGDFSSTGTRSNPAPGLAAVVHSLWRPCCGALSTAASTGCGIRAEVPARSGRIRPHAVRSLCEHTFCHACKIALPVGAFGAFPQRCRAGVGGVHCAVMVPPGQVVAPLPPQNLDAEESVLG